MTRIPLPPLAVLSQDGALAASAFGPELSLVDLTAGTLTRLTLPHAASVLALSPRGTFLAAAGDGQMSLLRPRSPGSAPATAPLPAPLFRVAIAEEGIVAGAINFWGERSALGVWRGEGLRADFAGEGAPLGRFAPFQLLLDGARERALLAGVRGPGAFSGGGDRFVALVSLGAGTVAVEWKGEDLPFPPEGFLFPLAEGRLGIIRRDELAIVALPPDVEAPREVGRASLPSPEKVAVSPNGEYLTWLSGLGPREETRVRVARPDGEMLDQAAFRELGSFPSIAVDDAGRATIVYSEPPNRVRALSLSNGKLEERLVATVAAEESETEGD